MGQKVTFEEVKQAKIGQKIDKKMAKKQTKIRQFEWTINI